MSDGPAVQTRSEGAVAAMPAGARPQLGSDEVLFEGVARHSVVLGGYLKGIAVCVAGGAVGVGLRQIEALATWPLWLLALVGLPVLLMTYLRHTTSRFKVSGRRVETEMGILSKRVDSLELWRILDVRYEQSFADRIFNNAKIILIGTDQSHPMLTLHGLPNHRALFEKLRDAVQTARLSSRPMEVVPGHDAAALVGHDREHHL
ncbi:MAG: PH domain-containing protein [Nannocystis sp.]|nr:PH domain-containing protein [Nannocystis sp.]